MEQNPTSQLLQMLQMLSQAFQEAGLNNKTHLQVINHSVMVARDESSLETLIIGFNSYEDSPEEANVKAAEFIFSKAKEFILKPERNVLNYKLNYETDNMLVCSVTDSSYVTILCSDETVYVTCQYAANF